MVDLILLLIIGVLLFFLIVATMAPLESLGWYAGWIGEKVDDAHTLDVLSEVEATKEPLPAELELTAFTMEGEVMGVRHRDYHSCVGVQFHPESILTEHGKDILRNFLTLGK